MAIRDLAWDDLRLLLAVERTGSLAGAAAAAGVDKATVGRRIAGLQEAAGAVLVERGSAGSTLTAAGRRACAVARAMEEAALSLERDIGGADATFDGDVRLHAPEAFVPLLARALAELRARHPGIRVEILTGTTELNLVRREADIGIRMMVPAQARLVRKKVASAPWGVFASEAYLARRGVPDGGGDDDDDESWAAHDVIAYTGPIATAPGPLFLAQHAKHARVVMRTNNALSATAAAAEGMGVVAAPAFIAHDARLRSVVTRPIGAGTVLLVAHRALVDVPRIRATWDHLAHWFQTRWPS